MFKILCISNRKLCCEDLLVQTKKIISAKPDGFILREKDLSQREYACLVKKVAPVCKEGGVPLILHTHIVLATALEYGALHLTMTDLRRRAAEGGLNAFKAIGASCHSVEEAKEAQGLGATYLTASHIFETDCKKDLQPKGLDFLVDVCRNVSIPVFALGGISEKNITLLPKTGVSGAALMGAWMKSPDPMVLIKNLRDALHT